MCVTRVTACVPAKQPDSEQYVRRSRPTRRPRPVDAALDAVHVTARARWLARCVSDRDRRRSHVVGDRRRLRRLHRYRVGRRLIAKLIVVSIAAAWGVYNHFRVVPKLVRTVSAPAQTGMTPRASGTSPERRCSSRRSHSPGTCADGDTGASVNRLTEAPERCQVGRTPPKIRQTTRCCPTRKNLTMEP